MRAHGADVSDPTTGDKTTPHSTRAEAENDPLYQAAYAVCKDKLPNEAQAREEQMNRPHDPQPQVRVPAASASRAETVGRPALKPSRNPRPRTTVPTSARRRRTTC
jgi:hypothetical protein